MTVYVDDLLYKKRNGRKFYCHMFADTLEELHEFAAKIGRKRCWYHKSVLGYLHYDLDEKFRTLAVEAGAVEIDTRDAVMARKLSKTIGEYLANEGWSSKLFLPHAQHAFENVQGKIDVGRTVIYVTSAAGKMIKAYVHANGRSHEFVTFTDALGTELETVHFSISPQEFTSTINKLLA